MSDNAGFFVLAHGHYPARIIEVHIRLRSTEPDKQLLELDYLVDAITEESKRLRARLLEARPKVAIHTAL